MKKEHTKQLALEKVAELDGNVARAAREVGVPRRTLRRWLDEDRTAELQDEVGSGVMEAIAEAGANAAVVKDLWLKSDGASIRIVMPGGSPERFLEMVRDAATTAANVNRKLPKRFKERSGNLLVLDPADVHIGKLCIESETGNRYDQSVATHRLAEGCRVLLERGKLNGCTRVLFIIGNDIAHIDNTRKTTTAGTIQDTDGSLFTIYQAAIKGYTQAIEKALEMEYAVDLVFNPSNHDFVLGYAIAQTISAWFKGHPNVSATTYNMSEVQRKYYRFGNNLIGMTHGGDAKENDLPSLMITEARSHVADCLHRYWFVHHYHHKIRKKIGLNPQAREKDHIGMTRVDYGLGSMEGDNFQIEYVRSPSAPDGWHFRNGYINRQAVEAFVHHPTDGQIMRLTEWF